MSKSIVALTLLFMVLGGGLEDMTTGDDGNRDEGIMICC